MELQEADETEACSAECAADEELRAELRVDETVERKAEWAAEAVMRPLNSGSRRVAAQARVARRAEDETAVQALRDGTCKPSLYVSPVCAASRRFFSSSKGWGPDLG